jgi:hypothetical protein
LGPQSPLTCAGKRGRINWPALPIPHRPPPEDGAHKKDILVRTHVFAEYASLRFTSPRPLGNPLVQSFPDELRHAAGFVVCENQRCETLHFRGAMSSWISSPTVTSHLSGHLLAVWSPT